MNEPQQIAACGAEFPKQNVKSLDVCDRQVYEERAVLELVNAERKKAGREPVEWDEELAELARAFSRDMAERGFFDHTDPDGDDPWERAEQAGVEKMGGENIAKGHDDGNAVIGGWMKSPGHKANILRKDHRRLGVGVHFCENGEDGPWWTQDFGF